MIAGEGERIAVSDSASTPAVSSINCAAGVVSLIDSDPPLSNQSTMRRTSRDPK